MACWCFSQKQKHMDKAKQWLKRIGIVGFLFFFIKGLVWLAIFLGVGSLFVK